MGNGESGSEDDTKKMLQLALKKLGEVMESDISYLAKVLYAKIFAKNLFSASWVRYRRCDDALRSQLEELERIGALKLHRSKPIDEEHPGYTLILDEYQGNEEPGKEFAQKHGFKSQSECVIGKDYNKIIDEIAWKQWRTKVVKRLRRRAFFRRCWKRVFSFLRIARKPR